MPPRMYAELLPTIWAYEPSDPMDIYCETWQITRSPLELISELTLIPEDPIVESENGDEPDALDEFLNSIKVVREGRPL